MTQKYRNTLEPIHVHSVENLWCLHVEHHPKLLVEFASTMTWGSVAVGCWVLFHIICSQYAHASLDHTLVPSPTQLAQFLFDPFFMTYNMNHRNWRLQLPPLPLGKTRQMFTACFLACRGAIARLRAKRQADSPRQIYDIRCHTTFSTPWKRVGVTSIRSKKINNNSHFPPKSSSHWRFCPIALHSLTSCTALGANVKAQ